MASRARRNGTASPGHVQGHNLVLASAAMGVLSLGLILVGITLPLTSRVEGAESDMMLLGYLMVGWLLISTAGWMFVVARASRPGIMILTAGLALGGMALAAALTAGAA